MTAVIPFSEIQRVSLLARKNTVPTKTSASKHRAGCRLPLPTINYNGRKFWPAVHDREPNVRLSFSYTETGPLCSDVALQFDIRNLPHYRQEDEPGFGQKIADLSKNPATSERRFLDRERRKRAYHASVIAKCLDAGMEPMEFRARQRKQLPTISLADEDPNIPF